jgi:hypothetical protein
MSEAGQDSQRRVSLTGGDPTQNVAELVSAEGRHQDAMRAAETIRLDQLARLRRDYETQLAGTRRDFENQVASILAGAVKEKSDLVSSQLVQIQTIFDIRVAKLEEFRLTQIGRSSVADPALATALADLANNQKISQDNFTEALDSFAQKTADALMEMAHSIASLKLGARQTTGEALGKREVVAWAVAAASVVFYAFTMLHTLLK